MAAVADFLSAGFVIALSFSLVACQSHMLAANSVAIRRHGLMEVIIHRPPVGQNALTQLAVPRLLAECKKLQVC